MAFVRDIVLLQFRLKCRISIDELFIQPTMMDEYRRFDFGDVGQPRWFGFWQPPADYGLDDDRAQAEERRLSTLTMHLGQC